MGDFSVVAMRMDQQKSLMFFVVQKQVIYECCVYAAVGD